MITKNSPSKTYDEHKIDKLVENVKIVNLETRNEIQIKISALISRDSSCLRRHINLGINSVTKSLESVNLNGVAIVFIAKDAHAHNCFSNVVELCQRKEVPVLFLPKMKTEFARLFGMKRLSCFSVNTSDENIRSIDDDIHLDDTNAKVDHLRDFLTKLSSMD